MEVKHKTPGHRDLTERDLTEEEKILIEKLKNLEKETIALIRADNKVDIDGRSAAVAITNLETAFMWATKAVIKPNDL